MLFLRRIQAGLNLYFNFVLIELAPLNIVSFVRPIKDGMALKCFCVLLWRASLN